MSVSYLEQYHRDVAFRKFVDTQRGQDAVELQALKIEYAHAQAVIESQKQRIAELEPQPKRRTSKSGETLA